MATEYGLEVLVTPIVDSAAAAAMGAKTAQSFSQGFERNLSKQPLGRITGQVSEFQKSMEAAMLVLLHSGAFAGSIYLVKVAFDKLIGSTVEVEKGLANINVILGLGQTALKSFSNEMFKAAANTGQTFETASKVALEFARHGVSATETVKRMTSAMELMRISGLSAVDSVNSITAAINAFNKEGLTSEDVVNRLTAVDTKFAVSAQDLAKAIQRVGATAEDAGVRFNELLGFVTAAQTVTARGDAVIGNAFKSIFTRLARPQVLDDLEAIGVATRTTGGQILPMVSILKSLAATYDTLSYSQKSFITQAVGGVYQVNILKAFLVDLGNGMSIFDKASLAASQSAGLIDQRMSALNETLASKVNSSMLEVTKLFSNFGNIAFGDSAKSGVDFFNQQLSSISDKLEDIKPDDSVGEKIGKTLGQGISKGIGDILSGPVVQMVTALGFKAMGTLGTFAFKSGKEFLGKNSDAEKLKYIQKDITKFVNENAEAQALVNSELNKSVELSELYLKHLSAAAAFQAKVNRTTGGAAGAAAISLKASLTPTQAAGYVPSFAANQEINQARALGAPPSVQAQWGRGTIGGQSFVMNNKEMEIPHFGANGDSAVLPMYAKGHVPNFVNLNFESSQGKFGITQIRGYLGKQRVGDLEYSEDDEKAKEIEYFGIDKKHQGQGYAKQFYQAMGPGKAHGIILPNFDRRGNVFFPQLSRATVAKDASVVYHGVLSKSEGPQPRKNYTIDEFKQLIAQHQQDKNFWNNNDNSFELITNHAKGFIPNFANIDLYRGVGGSRFHKPLPHAGFGENMSEEEIRDIVFAKKAPSPNAVLRQKDVFYSQLGGGPKFSLKGLRRFLESHETYGGNSQGSGLLSTSLDMGIAKEFGYHQKISIPEARILTHENLTNLLERLGPTKLSRVLMNSTSEANAKRGRKHKFFGFDVNSLLRGLEGSPGYPREKEIALMNKGFVPNFALDKVFSMLPVKRIKGGDYSAMGTEYEKQLIQNLPQHGFSDIIHLSGGPGKHNYEADIFARYQGEPWLLDGKHSPGGGESKLSSLAEKERTMRALLSRIQANPGSFPHAGPDEIASMKLGVILSQHPLSTRIKGYKKAGLPYQALVAGGFIPNFGLGDDRFNQIGQFLMKGVKKSLPINKGDYEDSTRYLGDVSAAQLDKDIKDGYFGGGISFWPQKDLFYSQVT